MNGEYLSYYPQFESNQVLTSAHLNELRQYLDEQIRLTRSQLIGVGVCAGLTFKVVTPTKSEKDLDKSLNFDYGIRVFAGFGVSSEGFLIQIEGEKVEPELPTEDPYRSTRYSDYIKYRKYQDQSPDLYWHKGSEANPQQVDVTELLTELDSQQLILDGADPKTIHTLTAHQTTDKVLVLYLELQDIALRSCVGKDCDNKGSKRYITPRVLLMDRDTRAGINGTTKKAEILVVNLDGLLMRQPYPKQMRAPRLISGLKDKGTPLQKIHAYNTLGEGYLAAIAKWQTQLAKEISASHERYGPFLGLTDKDIDQIAAFKSMEFPSDHAQYGLDLLKDLTRGLNEFNLLAYELKRDVCNEGYIFPRHLMLGTVPHDDEYRERHYDKYRNYFIQFGLTPQQDRKLRQAQMLFVRLLQQIKHYLKTPSNKLNDVGSARMVPSQEDEYLVGLGTIPDYYQVTEPLAQNWDPDRYLNGLHDEVLSFEPEVYSLQAHVKMPFCYDIDDKPFLRIQNLVGLDITRSVEAVEESVLENNLALEVIPLKLGMELSLADLKAAVSEDAEWVQLESQYHQQRAELHAMVANVRGYLLAHNLKDLQKGVALPMDLSLRYLEQTPVMDNLLYALGAATLYDFIAKDGLPTMVKGFIPNYAADGLAELYQYMYSELRTLAQYVQLLLRHQRDIGLRNPADPCDLTDREGFRQEVEEALGILANFLDNRQWVQFQNLIRQAQARLDLVRVHSPRLFHNFAKLHPGIEHLGGSYKGGTYALVYEERVKRIETSDGGILDEIKGDINLFRSEFDMEAIFQDEEGAGEMLMDMALDEEPKFVESGPVVTREELQRLTKLLVDVIERMDDGYLKPDDSAMLLGQHPGAVWETYLGLVAAATDKDLSPKMRAQLTDKYLEMLSSVDQNTLEKREIQPWVWEQYKTAIADGNEFVPQEEGDGIAAFKEYLVEAYSEYGKVILSETGMQSLKKATVPDIWTTYLSLYAKSTGERFLDMDVQRNLLDGFLEVLELADPDRAARDHWSDDLQDYIQLLRQERKRLASTDLKARPADPNLVEILVGILENTLRSPEVLKMAGLSGDLPGIQFLKEINLDAIWPTLQSRLERAIPDLKPGTIDRLKDAYHSHILLAIDRGVGFDGGFTEGMQAYADYLAVAGPADNPFMRQALLGILDNLGGKLVPEEVMDRLAKLSATAMWPTFLREYLRAIGRPGDLQAAQEAQMDFAQAMMKIDVGRLQEQGIDAEWYRYTASLMAPVQEQPDYMGEVVRKALEVMTGVESNGIYKPMMLQMRTLQPEALLPTYLDSVRGKEGELLDLREKSLLRGEIIHAIQRSNMPGGSPKELVMLWNAYQDSLTVELPGRGVRQVVVADFALPYPAKGSLDTIPAHLRPVPPPMLVLQGDTAVVTPGASVDIRILENDDLAGRTAADASTDLVVAILSVVHPSGALGGKATLISDPNSSLPNAPKNILRYEAFFGVPLAGGEVAEITYQVTDPRTQQSAQAKVLVLTRRPLGIISEPCCCCKDYTYVLTQGDKLTIHDPFEAFADRAPFVLRLLTEEGDEATSVVTPEFSATLLRNSLQVQASLLFEGTVRLPYRIRYEGGRAYCEGVITVIVTCRCQLMPCEVTVAVTAGEEAEARNVLSLDEMEEGMQVRLKGNDGNPTDILNNPFPQIVGVRVAAFDADFPDTILQVKTDGSTSTSALVPFYKGVQDGDDFVIHGECTLVILVNPGQAPCMQEYDIPGSQQSVLKTVLSQEEAAEGVELRFDQNGAPVYNLAVMPSGLISASIVSVTGSKLAYQAFQVQPYPGFKGTVTFPFYKGVMKGDVFNVISSCTMILHVLPPLIVPHEYTILENETLVIDDLLSQGEIESGLRLRFPQNVGPETSFSTFPVRLSLNTQVNVPEGAASLELVALAKGAPDSGFMLQPILGFNGLITWNYEVYLDGGINSDATSSGTIEVTVKPVLDFEATFPAEPEEKMTKQDLLSPKEAANGYEVRFFDGAKLVDTLPLPTGANVLQLEQSETGAFNGWSFQSIPNFDGDCVFRVAVVSHQGRFLVAHRIYTVTVQVRPVIVSGPFGYEATVSPDQTYLLSDILNADDMSRGMVSLRFMDKLGFPVQDIPEMPSGLLEASLGAGGLSQTVDSALKVTLGAAKEGTTIAIPMIKGVMGIKGFITMTSGQVLLHVGGGNGKPFFESIQVVPGKPAMVDTLLTEKELANGVQLRFMGHAEEPTLEIPLPGGLNFAKIGGLPKGGSLNSIVVVNADGSTYAPITIQMYKVLEGQFGLEIVASGQLTVNVSYGLPFPSFAVSRNVAVDTKVFLEDLFDTNDKEQGLDQLHFWWTSGEASKDPEYIPVGLKGLAILETPDSTYGKVGLRADGTQPYVQVPLYKGRLFEGSFIPMTRGHLTVYVDVQGGLPIFDLNREIQVDDKVDLVDLLTEQDVREGMVQLAFVDKEGGPTNGFYDSRLAFIFLTPLGISQLANSALQLQAVATGTIVVPLLKGAEDTDGFKPLATGQLVLTVVANGKSGLPNYNFDNNFGQYSFYNPNEFEQYQSQVLLNGVQELIEANAKDLPGAGQAILSSYYPHYHEIFRYLSNRVSGSPSNSPQMEYYMRILTLELDSLIEVTKFVGDVNRWGGLDSLFEMATQAINQLRNYGIYYSPVGNILTDMLNKKVIPPDSPELSQYVTTWRYAQV